MKPPSSVPPLHPHLLFQKSTGENPRVCTCVLVTGCVLQLSASALRQGHLAQSMATWVPGPSLESGKGGRGGESAPCPAYTSFFFFFLFLLIN